MDDKALQHLIAEAIADGAIDETGIIIYAEARQVPKDDMDTLRKFLARAKGSRAKAVKGFVPDFTATMRVRVGRHNHIERLEDHREFEKNIHHWRMSLGNSKGGWEGLEVEVHGEVTDLKEGEDHIDVLLEKAQLIHQKEKKTVPKIWASISPDEFVEVEKEHIMRGDWIELHGRIVWDGSIHFLKIKHTKGVRLDND